MHLHQHLMVGLAHTGADSSLIRYAAMITRLGIVNKISFAHVLPDTNDTFGLSSPLCFEEVLNRLQDEVHSHFTDASQNVQVCFNVLHGPVLDRLLEHANDNCVDVLLVGEGRKASGRNTLARQLTLKAPCSVWLAPPNAQPQIRRVLVPVDFSENAADAVQIAASLAQISKPAELLLLHVYFNKSTGALDDYNQVLRGQKEQDYRQFISPIRCRNVRLTPLFEEGNSVSRAIRQVAEQHHVDLIVMSTRGRSRLAAIVLGSLTEAVIRGSNVPLLAVKHFGASMNVLEALLDHRIRERGDVHCN